MGLPRFVLSDWGGAHSTAKASAAGLDHEEPTDWFFGPLLKTAVESGEVPLAQVDDHARRILRSMFAVGVIDDPPRKSVIDVMGGLAIAQSLAEQSIVLLKNRDGLLPLDASKPLRIAVIGAHADVGMISGGGSAQVDPPGGNAIMPPGQGATTWQAQIWFPTSPLRALRAAAPLASIEFDSGANPEQAAALASRSDVALVFAWQWECEGRDLADLSLPDHQDALIEKIAAANPRTVVVLETGSPVTMPWATQVGGIFEAWYAGSRGAEAVARLVFGQANPSAKLPITFPASELDLPHPHIAQPTRTNPDNLPWAQAALGQPTFPALYDEGLKVGYKWYESVGKQPLFPFGHGLSYTSYRYADLFVEAGPHPSVRFKLTNVGTRSGAEIAQVYAALPASAKEPPQRLVAFRKIKLGAGESQLITLPIEPQLLSIFDPARAAWQLVPGDYTLRVGGSSQALPLQAEHLRFAH